jgi:branched-chain amino acid transport system substrate-binding protein
MKLSVRRRAVALLASAFVLCSAAGCALGGEGGDDSGSGPIKVGVLTDVTGPIAQGQEHAVKGAQARIDALNAEGGIDGRQVELVVGDAASSPQGMLTAAKKLIQQDKVEAILAWSYLFNTAADYIESQKIPVFGGSYDPAPQWGEHETMFGTQPTTPATVATSTTYPKIFAERGVTKVAIVGLDAGKAATDSVAQSVEEGGMKVVYLNQTVAITDSDFTSVALAIKKSGADGVYMAAPAVQIYGLAAAMRQQDVKLKMYLGAVGYGQDLLDNPTALASAEGAAAAFISWYAPKELDTAATKKMADNLAEYADYEGAFDFSAAGPYLNAVGFIAAAEAGGAPYDAASIIKGAKTLDDFDFEGLLAHPVDWSKPDPVVAPGLGYGSCVFVTTVTNGAFEPLSSDPFCGTSSAS